MPILNCMRHVNKRSFNRWELARGNRPVLIHEGRVSGDEYRTPLEPRAIDGGYVFLLMYGAKSTDWVQNVLAAGRGTLVVDGEHLELVNPRVSADKEHWEQLPNSDDRPPKFLNVTELLQMDVGPVAKLATERVVNDQQM